MRLRFCLRLPRSFDRPGWDSRRSPDRIRRLWLHGLPSLRRSDHQITWIFYLVVKQESEKAADRLPVSPFGALRESITVAILCRHAVTKYADSRVFAGVRRASAASLRSPATCVSSVERRRSCRSGRRAPGRNSAVNLSLFLSLRLAFSIGLGQKRNRMSDFQPQVELPHPRLQLCRTPGVGRRYDLGCGCRNVCHLALEKLL